MHDLSAAGGESPCSPSYSLDFMACCNTLRCVHVYHKADKTKTNKNSCTQHQRCALQIDHGRLMMAVALQHRNMNGVDFALWHQHATPCMLLSLYRQSIKHTLGTSMQMTPEACICNKQTAMQQQAQTHTLLQVPISTVMKHPIQVCI